MTRHTSRDEIRELRKFLKQPFPGVYVKRLRTSLQAYKTGQNFLDLLTTVRELQQIFGTISTSEATTPALNRDDLHLVCYEYVCSG